jgi:hypothetical protein
MLDRGSVNRFPQQWIHAIIAELLGALFSAVLVSFWLHICTHISPLKCMYYPSNTTWCYHLYTIWLRIQIIKILVTRFPQPPALPLGPKCFSEHSFLKHSRSSFSMRGRVLDPNKTASKIIILYICIFTFRRGDEKVTNSEINGTVKVPLSLWLRVQRISRIESTLDFINIILNYDDFTCTYVLYDSYSTSGGHIEHIWSVTHFQRIY